MMRGASRALRSARLTLQRLLKDKRGSVLAFFVALPVVAGTVAVGVETGQLYRTKRQMCIRDSDRDGDEEGEDRAPLILEKTLARQTCGAESARSPSHHGSLLNQWVLSGSTK